MYAEPQIWRADYKVIHKFLNVGEEYVSPLNPWVVQGQLYNDTGKFHDIKYEVKKETILHVILILYEKYTYIKIYTNYINIVYVCVYKCVYVDTHKH